ncbi:Kinesin-like protein kif20a [Cichlidogyrus casuarinus]|uniref:Kinesin-like protein n=1 Tax=Cichlidogyrus casuarinus TaxID=1844966 RepID=A0ABD2QLB8_9PLAT
MPFHMKLIILRFYKDLSWYPVSNVTEAMKLLEVGRMCQQVASTKLNTTSSRSHCIFTIKMVRIPKFADCRVAKLSSLSFCDLAGSERCVKAATQGNQLRLREAANINNSLIVFGRCLEILRSNQNPFDKPRWVPYRESKLTMLFRAFFSGHGFATMIVTASQDDNLIDETLHTLKFSAIAREVRLKLENATNEVQISDDTQPVPVEKKVIQTKKPLVTVSESMLEASPAGKLAAWSSDEESPERTKSDNLIPYLRQLSHKEVSRLFCQIAEQLHQARAEIVRNKDKHRIELYQEIDKAISDTGKRYS